MHIAIEGLDGAGKTSVAKRLAEDLGYVFQECPIYDLIGREGVRLFFENLRHIDGDLHSDIAAMVFGAGNLYLRQYLQRKNIVTDRHLCSTYLFDASKDNGVLFDFLVQKCGSPDFTVILYADAEERKKRIMARNPDDPDLNEDIFTDEKYYRAIEFLQRYQMKYSVIDNTHLNILQTVETIKKELAKE